MHNTKQIKRILFAVMLLTTAGILIVFAAYRYLRGPADNLHADLQNQSTMALDKIEHTATKNGVSQWRLSADSARLVDSANETVFEKLAVVFFMPDGSELHLKANHGLLKIDSNDMEVAGNVVVQNGPYRLETDRLNYNHNQRMILTRVPVKITGGAFNLTAASMSLDITTQQTSLMGNVKGSFNENLAL